MHPTFGLLRDFRTVSTEAEPVYIPCSHVKVAQWLKNPPAMQEMQEMQARPLGREDCLDEGMGTHSSILAWKIPWTERPGGLQSVGRKELDE